MTAPIGGGIAAMFDVASASPATAFAGLANGASANGAVDPAAAKFAGLLARVVGEQGLRSLGGPRDPDAMLQSALASLEAAMGEGGATGAVATEDAGTAAIKALLAQVTRTDAATAWEAQGANAALAPQLDATAQALGAAAAIKLPGAPVLAATESKGTAKQVGEASKQEEDATRTDNETDARQAASNALAANAAADPSAIVRDLATLDPAFRAKLERVMDRMQHEFGHKVTIVETTRSQERQDALFAQGRSTPGQVVTWTKNSRHADGLAADVLIDGSYDNPAAFERLQRIANEEGLHTLGSRDPGHLELRVPQSGSFTTKMSQVVVAPPHLRGADTPARAAGGAVSSAANSAASLNAMSRISRVAQVAEVAVTAGVARVATVASVAVPGTTGPATANSNASINASVDATAKSDTAPARTGAVAANEAAPVAPRTTTTAAPTAAADTARAMNAAGAAGAGSRERSNDSDARGARKQSAPATDATAPIVAPTLSAPRGTSGTTPMASVAAPDQASRVAQIDDLQERQAAQPVSSMVLNVDDGNGGTDRIRVDVRGSSVAAQVDTRDANAAAQLNARGAELARALESRGLEADGLRVRTVSSAPNSDLLRNAVSAEGAPRTLGAALSAESSTPSRRDRDDARDPRGQDNNQDQNSPRQRSRREREEQQS